MSSMKPCPAWAASRRRRRHHKYVHVAATLDDIDGRLDTRSFPLTRAATNSFMTGPRRSAPGG
jgi:hypothetical protein